MNNSNKINKLNKYIIEIAQAVASMGEAEQEQFRQWIKANMA